MSCPVCRAAFNHAHSFNRAGHLYFNGLPMTIPVPPLRRANATGYCAEHSPKKDPPADPPDAGWDAFLKAL
jgi:hypothetical protein